MKSVKVLAPATVANVCCGFDVLGFCMEDPCDEIVVSLNDSGEVVITKIEGDGGKLSRDANKNTAGVSVKSLLASLNKKQGVEIEIYKKLPLGSGMGSSAASAVAAVVGVNQLLGNPLSRNELIPHVMESERVACGSAHADNAAPGLLGGFTLIRSYSPLDVVGVPFKAKLFCGLVHPQMELKTSDSRKVLRGSVALKDSITQSGNIAALMIGLITPDYQLISRSLQDVIAEPTRSAFIPGFDDMKRTIMDAGAIGFGISGSGPTVFLLCQDRETTEKAALLAQMNFKKSGLPSTIYISAINEKGATIIQ